MTKLLTYIFIFLFTFTSSVNAGYSDAINRGKTGAGIFSLKNFGNENTNGMSKTEWIIANADKDTISNGNLGLVSDLYNTATKKGEGEPFIISSVLTGLVVAGSLYSIQDSARKIYAWFDGEGYNGKTTYIDPIDGRIYTAEENLKEGTIELGAAATAGIVVKGVGKVVSKAKAAKTLSKAKATKNTNKLHKNSNCYNGKCWLYQIDNKTTGEPYKIGETAIPPNSTGKLPRAQYQVNKLNKNSTDSFDYKVIGEYNGKAEVRKIETKTIDMFRFKNPDSLPGNKGRR